MDSTCYYDQHAKEFYERTIHLDEKETYQKFLNYVPRNARILDAGCGVGRDVKFFEDNGFDVVAFDGSIEMAKMASSLLGKQVLHMRFEEVDFFEEFDAVWANASLLHVPYENLREVLKRLHGSLRHLGIFYASFKHGSCMRHVSDRFFFDMNEELIERYVEGLFEPLEIWKSFDQRSRLAPSPDRSLFHFLGRRIEC